MNKNENTQPQSLFDYFNYRMEQLLNGSRQSVAQGDQPQSSTSK